MVDRDLYAEMHKRVGHITVMQARYGAFNSPIEQMTFQALDQWISFFGELRTSWIYDGSPRRKNSEIIKLSFKRSPMAAGVPCRVFV